MIQVEELWMETELSYCTKEGGSTDWHTELQYNLSEQNNKSWFAQSFIKTMLVCWDIVCTIDVKTFLCDVY